MYIFATKPDFKLNPNNPRLDPVIKTTSGHKLHACTDWMTRTDEEPFTLSWKDQNTDGMAVCEFELPSWVYLNLARMILGKFLLFF